MPDGACWQHVALCLVGESGLSIPELGHENFDPEGAENQGWRVCAGADVPAGAIQGAFCGLEWTCLPPPFLEEGRDRLPLEPVWERVKPPGLCDL